MSILDIDKLNIINLGLESFKVSLKKQDVQVVHINWKPEANGNLRLLEIIDKIEELDI